MRSGLGSGAREAAAPTEPLTPPRPLPCDVFEFSEPRYGGRGDVRPRHRQGTETSLAEWVAVVGGAAGDGDEAARCAAGGDGALGGAV